MKKEVVIILVILTFLTKVGAEYYQKECSDVEVKLSWNDLFYERSNGITIFKGESETFSICDGFFAYKVVGEKVFILRGSETSTESPSYILHAMNLNATQEFINILTGFETLNDTNELAEIEEIGIIRNYSQPRNPPLDSSQLTTKYISIYKSLPTDWYQIQNVTELDNDTIFYFNTSEEVSDTVTVEVGELTKNHDYSSNILSYFDYSDSNISCESNWNCTQWTNCTNNVKTRTCVDLNDCSPPTTEPTLQISCNENCTSNWDCTNWSECSEGVKTRTCVDKNNCRGEDTQNIPCGCSPQWTCGDWSSCIGGLQVRNCFDENDCNTLEGKPIENQVCGGSGCVPDWDCTEWEPDKCPSDTKTQTRICTDLNSCGSLAGKPEEAQSCTGNFGWIIAIIVTILTILIVGTFFVIRERRKKIKNTLPDESGSYTFTSPSKPIPPTPSQKQIEKPNIQKIKIENKKQVNKKLSPTKKQIPKDVYIPRPMQRRPIQPLPTRNRRPMPPPGPPRRPRYT